MVVTSEGASRLERRNVCTVVFARLLQSLSGVSHPIEISVPIITISTSNRIQKDKVRNTSLAKPICASYSVTSSSCVPSTSSCRDQERCEANTVFTLDDKITPCKIWGVRLILPRLGDHVDK